MSAPYGPDTGYGVVAVRSIGWREIEKSPCTWFVGVIATSAADVFENVVDSKILLAGLPMAKITATGKWTPWKGADVLSAVAIGSQIIYVGVTNISRFAVGDNVKVGKNTADAIIKGEVQDLGAILTKYLTSGTFAVTADIKVISAIAVGDTVFVEPATADGSGVAIGLLMDNVEMRATASGMAGLIIEREARIARMGFVKTTNLRGMAHRASLTLAGQGQTHPVSMLLCD